LDHARSVEVLAYFAEHVAALGVERADGEGVRICLRVPARDSQFFGLHMPRSLLRRTAFLQSSELFKSSGLVIEIFPVIGR
jgi:hypothetical protein